MMCELGISMSINFLFWNSSKSLKKVEGKFISFCLYSDSMFKIFFSIVSSPIAFLIFILFGSTFKAFS